MCAYCIMRALLFIASLAQTTTFRTFFAAISAVLHSTIVPFSWKRVNCIGSGSVPVAAKMLGRRCYASELVAERAEEARARLAAIPEPMEFSMPVPEQAALVFEDAA